MKAAAIIPVSLFNSFDCPPQRQQRSPRVRSAAPFLHVQNGVGSEPGLDWRDQAQGMPQEPAMAIGSSTEPFLRP